MPKSNGAVAPKTKTRRKPVEIEPEDEEIIEEIEDEETEGDEILELEDEEDEEEEEEDDLDGLLEEDEEDDELTGLVSGAPGSASDPASFSSTRKAISLDFRGVEDGPPQVEPGDYTGRVTDVEACESSAGNPQLVWSLQVTSGKHKNLPLKLWTSLMPNARWATARALKALGIPAAGKVFELDPNEVKGKPCIIRVKKDDRNPDFPFKVDRLLPADAAAAKAAKSAGELI